MSEQWVKHEDCKCPLCGFIGTGSELLGHCQLAHKNEMISCSEGSCSSKPVSRRVAGHIMHIARCHGSEALNIPHEPSTSKDKLRRKQLYLSEHNLEDIAQRQAKSGETVGEVVRAIIGEHFADS